jgi:hypothetical protein
MTYEFRSHHGDKKATVEAPDEATARRLAMEVMWGSHPDPVVPYAPLYVGAGLRLVRAA